MQYRIEPHLHTVHASRCAQLNANALIAGYLEAGYSAIVVTDHFDRKGFYYLGIDVAHERFPLEYFLAGYRRMKALGDAAGIRVLRGAELRFDGDGNDYLLYGYSDALLTPADDIFRMGIRAFAPLAHADGALIVQAHPFRGLCKPADPALLDGVEVRNANPRHESRNELALGFAHANPSLLQLSGSDCHRAEDIGMGGILTATLPETEQGFVSLLRSGQYTLI